MNSHLLKFTDDFEYNIAGIRTQKSNLKGTYPIHHHDFYEFEVVIKGCGQHIINGNQFFIQEGDFWAVDINDYHIIETTDMTIYNIKVFPCNENQKLIELIQTNTFPFYGRLNENNFTYIKNLFEISMESYTLKSPCTNYKIVANTILIVSELIENANTISCVTNWHKKTLYVQKAIEFMHKHYNKQILLEDVAKQINLSPCYLSSIFTEITHSHFIEYLNKLRVQNACRQIITTNDSIINISESCGFSSVSSLNRLFKKHLNMSPTEYRSKHIG